MTHPTKRPWRSSFLALPLSYLSVCLLSTASVAAQDSLPLPRADYEPLSPTAQPVPRPAQPTP
ncbi:MAG: hypothetical protein VKI82_08475, partial [Leptolyngbya sp.]|nr:hypothetical protein [Leptolyngbya sp.]